MTKPKPTATTRDAQHAKAFLDLESDICAMRNAAQMSEMLHETVLKSGEPLGCSLKGLREAGYVVYVLTETQDRVLTHAVYHAGDLAVALHTKWNEACAVAA